MAQDPSSRVLCALVFAIFIAWTTAGSVRLPAYPLAVRSPWLSAWAKGNAANQMPSAQATFWDGYPLGWEIMARVDGQVYILFGLPEGVDGASNAFQTGINFTSTHTTVSLEAGSANIVLDFFSPVSPKDLLRQSLPYSYLTVTAITEGADVQIFSAIDEAWSGQVGNVTTNSSDTNGTSMYVMNNPYELTYEVKSNMAAWGSVVFATRPDETSNVSAQCGESLGIRNTFITNSGLLKSTSGLCDGGESSIFAYSHNFGTVAGRKGATFAIGQSRDEVVEYIEKPQASYHRAWYSTIPLAVSAFFDDYDAALAESTLQDDEVQVKATKVSPNYADIVEASVRQAFGAMEVTIPYDTLDTSNPMVFLKEISSDGNVNTVDVIYPTFPILYELAPQWIKYLMEPVLFYLISPGAWNLPYMIHDLGDNYPIANGHDNDKVEFFFHRPEFMPLDPTGSAMVMLYAYQLLTGDKSFAQEYHDLLHTYADFLATNGTASTKQLSTVDALSMTEYQTMLVVQSAIGLTAFGAMFGNDSYTKRGLELADLMYTQGEGLNKERTHFVFNYGPSINEESWSVMFPFFADKLLELNTFPVEAYDMMSTWYASHFDTYGLRYAEELRWGISDWNMWAAATSSQDIRSEIINTTHAFLLLETNNRPFQTKYDVHSGFAVANIARSTVGSNFALMNLNEVSTPEASTSKTVTSSSASLNAQNPLCIVMRMLGVKRRRT